MKTLFLGSYGFGNLGDELCLIEAMQAFPSSEVWAFSVDPSFTSHSVPGVDGYIRERSDIQTLRPERVVLGGGGVGFMPSIRDMLHWMDDARRLGAICHIHNIGVANMDDLEWTKAVQVQRVLNNLKSCSVRDDMSWMCMRMWPTTTRPSITSYPEYKLPQDNSIAMRLAGPTKTLGISITGQQAMRDALRGGGKKVERALSLCRDYAIVPVISTVSLTDPEEDDIAGFKYFEELYLDKDAVICREFLDRAWWRENMTALKLKGVIGMLDMLFTQRKHNLIHAIGTQTPVYGLYPTADDSIARIFFTMRAKMPFVSGQVPL